MSNADRCRRYRIKRHDTDMLRDMVRDMLPEIIQAVAEHFRHGGRHAMSRHAESSPPSPPLGSSLDSLPNPPLIPPSEKIIHSRVYDPRFARWYEGYPEKVGKGAAERSFLKALKSGATEEALAEGLRRYVAYKPHDRPWCNPATWLNQERWNDEYPAPKPNGHSPSYGRIRDPTEIMAEIAARDRAKELAR